MDATPIYQQIAESIRQEILSGALKQGDDLPTIREMSTRWNCTTTTVQKAYQQLARQGLVLGRAGQGTRVIGILAAQTDAPLRRARLGHAAESFLLQSLAVGYQVDEVEQAVRQALDHWRSHASAKAATLQHTLRFVGSHDPAVSLIAARFAEIAPGCTLHVTFAGSLGGMMALARGETDLAGSHLWDASSDSYNIATAQRLLPGQQVVLLTLAERRLGLLTPSGNPAGLTGLPDLVRLGVRFVNRQRGTGTRVWLDAQLARFGLPAAALAGYEDEVATHFDVARSVAEGLAGAGLGIEAAALAFSLHFVPLTTERYDFVIPGHLWQHTAVQALASWLHGSDARQAIANLGGYEVRETGKIRWIE